MCLSSRWERQLHCDEKVMPKESQDPSGDVRQWLESIPAGPVASRRRFLKETTLGIILLSAGGIHLSMCGTHERSSSRDEGFLFFSEQEYAILQAVARRIIGCECPIGEGPQEIDVALRADRFLAGADLEVQEQFHQLLVVFNAPLFAFLFDFRLSSFVSMSPETQDAYLHDWMTSPIAFRRTAFQALKRLCASMYYTDTRSWEGIEYTGMFLPKERI